MPGLDARRVEGLRSRLTVVRDRLVTAARTAERDPDALTLIAVSKTWPFEDVVALCSLGVRHFAENREQEAGPKAAAVHAALAGAGVPAPGDQIRRPGLPDGTPGAWFPSRADGPATLGSPGVLDVPVWHYVGQLQRNKARAVTGWAHYVQSVDRARLVETLSRAATERGYITAVCIQVNLDQEASPGVRPGPGVQKSLPGGENAPVAGAGGAARGGALPRDVPALAELVARAEGLVLAGVMAVAPRGVPPRPAFARLREVSERLRSDFPAATMVSAGMSSDLEDAVAEGATHLRIGTALFGERHGVP
ncbi:alanine racemase [Frankia sp. Cpl3]|nr:alanine racemase [Frankia sp. Cpl3]